jgi:hypothetical protein
VWLLQRIAQSDRQGRQHPLPVEFQNQRLKAYSFWSVFGTPEQAAEKVASRQEPRPQRLKPHSKQCSYRSAEALRHPKSRAKSSFSAAWEGVP